MLTIFEDFSHGMSSCDVAAYASNSSMALMMSSFSNSMSWILRGSPWLIPTTVS